jgi:hypothetical protein
MGPNLNPQSGFYIPPVHGTKLESSWAKAWSRKMGLRTAWAKRVCEPIHRADPGLRSRPFDVRRRVFYPANRPFFAEFPGTHAQSRRRIRQSRRKNAEFAAAAQPSEHTSPAAAIGRKFETG